MWGSITGTLSDQADLWAALGGKQATLVSGANIKTINGTTILGAGDLVISGGGGGASTFFARLPVDFTLLTQTASQQLFDTSASGALALDVGVYSFEAAIYLTGLSATSGNGTFSVLGSGTATTGNFLMQSVGLDNNSPLSSAARNGSGSATSSVKLVGNATGTGVLTVVSGHFEVTSAGTIIPSITLDDLPTAPVAKAGTTFRCTRMADTVVNTQGTWS